MKNKLNIFSDETKFISCDYEWRSFYNGTYVQKKWKQWIAKQVIDIAGECEDKTVVDIGCGSSPLGTLLDSREYAGIDANQEKVDFMKIKNRNNGKNRYYCGSAFNLGQFSTEYFDVALMIEVIEHFHTYQDAGKAVKEAVRIVKPSGLLIVATPNFRSPSGIMMDIVYDKLYKNGYAPDHHIRFGRESLNVLCASHGVKLEQTRSLLGADMVCAFRKVG